MKAVVLAAGKGKRLQTSDIDLPKVLRTIHGKPLLGYVLDSLGFIPKKDITIVVGYKREMVLQAMGEEYDYAVQHEQKGTGHAVFSAKDSFLGYSGPVLAAYGDSPLFKKETYRAMMEKHVAEGADCTVLTAVTDLELPYGRIIRGADGNLADVIEEKDCTPEQAAIKELNVGVYVFDAQLLFDNLGKLKNNNSQGEYYLTDVPKILMSQGYNVTTHVINDNDQILGINTIEDLNKAEKILCSNSERAAGAQ